MVDLFIGIVVLVIVGVAVFYIVRAKKKGVKCIGCPAAGNCAHASAGKCSCNCADNDFERNWEGCHSHTDTNE